MTWPQPQHVMDFTQSLMHLRCNVQQHAAHAVQRHTHHWLYYRTLPSIAADYPALPAARRLP
jgi:hypothetical protein